MGFAGLDNPPVVAALWRERKKERKEKDFREWVRERDRKREILERVRWWPIWRWDLKLTSKITTSTTTTNSNHFPIHFFFQVHPSLSFFNSPPLDWILSKPHLNFSAYLCRSFTFPSFLVKMVIWVCLVSLIWAVKICSFLNYNVDYVHGLFFSFPFLYYVLVTEENLSFGFWSLFNSHFSSLSDPKEAVVHNLSLSLSLSLSLRSSSLSRVFVRMIFRECFAYLLFVW